MSIIQVTIGIIAVAFCAVGCFSSTKKKTKENKPRFSEVSTYQITKNISGDINDGFICEDVDNGFVIRFWTTVTNSSMFDRHVRVEKTLVNAQTNEEILLIGNENVAAGGTVVVSGYRAFPKRFIVTEKGKTKMSWTVIKNSFLR